MSLSAPAVDAIGAGASGPALEVDDLRLVFEVRGIEREAIRGVSLRIDQGESIADHINSARPFPSLPVLRERGRG